MKKKLCLVVASEITIKAFLMEHLRALNETYQVNVVVNTDDKLLLKKIGLDIMVIPAAIERNLSPGKDIKALFFLCALFRKNKYDLIHSVTPKAGLLSMMAGFLAGVPLRIHTFTGQVWVTRSGFLRILLKTMDIILAKLATHILVDSPSQRQFLLRERVIDDIKSTVLAHGSISGVKMNRFVPDLRARTQVRADNKIPEYALVFLFLGRLNRDKGVIDLARAFAKVSAARDDCYLLLVGPDEENLQPTIEEIIINNHHEAGNLIFINYTSEPEKYMAAADVFCLPSYREGFGSVIIEAAAVGIPSIGTRIYGIADAIAENETGLLHELGDVNGLAEAMLKLAGNREMRNKMGLEARKRAGAYYDESIITKALLDFYAIITGE